MLNIPTLTQMLTVIGVALLAVILVVVALHALLRSITNRKPIAEPIRPTSPATRVPAPRSSGQPASVGGR
jgi:hypothetical protein